MRGNDQLARICAEFSDTELELLGGFLRRTHRCRTSATEDLAEEATDYG